MENGSKNSATPTFTVLGTILNRSFLCTSFRSATGNGPIKSLKQSLALGRPPSIRLSYVDTEFPDDDEAMVDAQGNTLVGCEFLSLTLRM